MLLIVTTGVPAFAGGVLFVPVVAPLNVMVLAPVCVNGIALSKRMFCAAIKPAYIAAVKIVPVTSASPETTASNALLEENGAVEGSAGGFGDNGPNGADVQFDTCP